MWLLVGWKTIVFTAKSGQSDFNFPVTSDLKLYNAHYHIEIHVLRDFSDERLT